MKDIPRFAATLTFVALIATGSLAWINEITKPKIFAQHNKELNSGLNYVLPGSESGVIVPIRENDNILYYEGYRDKAKTKLIGYAFVAEGKGYSSTIQTLVGIDSTGNIFTIKILFQKETPGLGTRCEEIRSDETTPWWQDQFKGMESKGVSVDKDGGEIQSITGATITSRAITSGIAQRATKFFQIIKNHR